MSGSYIVAGARTPAARRARASDMRVPPFLAPARFDDPIEAAYYGVYVWKKAVEKAGSFDVDKDGTVSVTLPANAASGVPTNTRITAAFSEAIYSGACTRFSCSNVANGAICRTNLSISPQATSSSSIALSRAGRSG